MPITLTTPKTISSPGQPSVTYSQLKIAGFDFPPPGVRLVLKLQYGDTVDGAWASKAPLFKCVIQDTPGISEAGYDEEEEEVVEVVIQAADPAFSNLVAASTLVGATVDGALLFDVVGDYLYNHLLAFHAGDSDYEGAIV